MTDYTLQECLLTLPELFHDHTMNLFTLGGANEFTFVISRAPARKEDTLQSVSTRLTRELKANLPELSIIKVELTELDGIPALELFYSFTSGQRTLLQKQRAVLLDDAFQGKKLLCFIGTSPDAFDASHTRLYDLITTTYKTRYPLEMLRSKAAPVLDTWSVPQEPFQTEGGGIQNATLIFCGYRAVRRLNPCITPSFNNLSIYAK